MWEIIKNILLYLYLSASGLSFICVIAALIYVRLGGELEIKYTNEEE